MAILGDDFAGGLTRRVFNSFTPAGPGSSLLVFVGILIFYWLIHGGIAMVISAVFLSGDFSNSNDMALAAVYGLLPLAVVMAPIMWQASKLRGGDPWEVLSLRWPRFTLLGWLVLAISFVIAIAFLFGVILSIVKLIGGDAQTGGIVEKTVEGIANHPLAFALVVPSLMIGAPVAEELLFRGQIFTALSQTRIGIAGASVLTAAGWASLHYTGSYLQVVLIFAMGLVLSWLMYRFGSVLVTIICHSAWNGLVALALLSAGGAAP